ncbi:hypothetical protein [Castellaniella sp.]|uniref:hypothetical protein n=1 Tax=Castellaniella sp. TaxID=1955812 RepID=UPI003560B9EC
MSPWPEVFADRKCLQAPVRNLRSVQKARARRSVQYAKWPAVFVTKGCSYKPAMLKTASIFEQMAADSGRDAGVFDLPDFGPSPVAGSRVALIRPVTIRREWTNYARAPRPEYIAQAAQQLHEAGFTVVSVADVDGRNEWIVGPEPYADVRFHAGELSITQMLALAQKAACAVGGVGWLTAACMASNVPMLCVLGGLLNRNAPQKVAMGEHRITWAWPDRPCWCDDLAHDCDKHIGGFDALAASWISTLEA